MESNKIWNGNKMKNYHCNADIVETLVEYNKEGIKKVFLGELDSFKLDRSSIDEAQTIMLGLGAISKEDFKTNGWEWDFWETWDYHEKEFILTGSGFYGIIDLIRKGNK